MVGENPVKIIIDVMRKEGGTTNPPSILLGEVIAPLPNLIVKVEGTQVDKDNLLLADYLLPDYTRNIKFSQTTSTGSTNSVPVGDHGSHSHSLDNIGIDNAEVTFKEILKSGDIVAVMPTADRQIFIILCKVVSLS